REGSPKRQRVVRGGMRMNISINRTDMRMIRNMSTRSGWIRKRRHLTTSQGAMIAARIANLKASQGINQHTPRSESNDTNQISLAQAAKQLNVSRPSVTRRTATV